jgi:hypothetical protein
MSRFWPGAPVKHRAARQQGLPRPAARIEIGGPAKDGLSLYACVQGSDTVMTISSSEAAGLGRLIELAGNKS